MLKKVKFCPFPGYYVYCAFSERKLGYARIKESFPCCLLNFVNVLYVLYEKQGDKAFMCVIKKDVIIYQMVGLYNVQIFVTVTGQNYAL